MPVTEVSHDHYGEQVSEGCNIFYLNRQIYVFWPVGEKQTFRSFSNIGQRKPWRLQPVTWMDCLELNYRRFQQLVSFHGTRLTKLYWTEVKVVPGVNIKVVFNSWKPTLKKVQLDLFVYFFVRCFKRETANWHKYYTIYENTVQQITTFMDVLVFCFTRHDKPSSRFVHTKLHSWP